MARRMARSAGLLCGLSSGANVWAALEVAKQASERTRIVTILPDSGAKYMSKLFNDEWLLSKGVLTEAELTEAELTSLSGPEARSPPDRAQQAYEHLLQEGTLEEIAFVRE
jgi:hypothetical protein